MSVNSINTLFYAIYKIWSERKKVFLLQNLIIRYQPAYSTVVEKQ